MQSRADWLIRSNAELGNCYSDIMISTPDRIGIVIEFKYADDGDLEKGCTDVLSQIEDKKYDAGLGQRRMDKIIKYGMTFCRKECMVVMAE